MKSFKNRHLTGLLITFSIFCNSYITEAQNLVTIEWIDKNSEGKNCSVVVYDILGKEVLSNEWKSNQKALKLDVSPLEIGFYYFTIYIDSIPFEVHKIQLSK